jgi:Asp-tRNA(Asn)/Glu-tRNA(Gln) amidotransferase B subunit
LVIFLEESKLLQFAHNFQKTTDFHLKNTKWRKYIMSWETVIGLEIHVQLSTNSKLFSGGSTGFGAEPNTHVDLIDMGLPGVLPVANREAFYKAIRFGLATNAEINQTSSFR